jgi:HAD superfamily hydrolase (TIGR01509 family)
MVIFDLDGVLIDGKHIHHITLNKAISEVAGDKYCISHDEHLRLYDGLKTHEKLQLLSRVKLLDPSLHDQIWKTKQDLTFNEFSKVEPCMRIRNIIQYIKQKSILVVCCTNSIRQTTELILSKLGIIDLFNSIISNEDVLHAKPYPEMYWKAMSVFGILPEEILIVEDSPPGLLGAYRSGGNVLRIKNSKELSVEKIRKAIKLDDNMKLLPKWVDKKMNIVIPMAGAGSRFEQAGYTFPKPLIDVCGKPMIQTVVENLNIDANYIFIVQKKHRVKYNLDSVLNLISPRCTIVETDGITEGAVCTVLLAKEHINNEYPLLLANSDQFVEWNSNEFIYKMHEQNIDGGILTFESTHPKWSYAKVDERGCITKVAEKNPISNTATVGIYFWKHGADFVKYAEQMITKNIRVNNEFYVCPVYNEAIESGKTIIAFNINRMWGLGTPEDLTTFIHKKKENESSN